MSRPLSRTELEEIYRRCGYQVERRCMSILRDAEAARDAAHEVFIKLMTRGHEFRGQSEWMTWLYRVATNLCLNRLRDAGNRRRLLELHGEAVVPSPGPSPESVKHRDALVKVMEAFDETTVEIAMYYFVDEMSQGEIARVVGLSRVTVNKRLQSFRARAAELLADMEAA